MKTNLRSILRFDLFYVECQITNFSGWIFGQSLFSDQHSETTPNSVCPIFWKSACEFVLRTTQREHDHNLVSYLVYLRYLQVLLDLRRTTTLLRYLQVRTGTSRSTENSSTTRFTVESDTVLLCTSTSYDNSLHTGILACSRLKFSSCSHYLNSWFSSYSLARRIYYLIHASFLRRVYYFKMHRLVHAKSCFLVHQLIVLY